MKTTCPHCTQHISIDPETLAELQGQEHFPCPACRGLVPVPQPTGAMPVAPARTDADTANLQSTPTPSTANTLAQAHRGLNRNLLILGSAALLVIGGLAFFIASRQGGDTHANLTNVNQEFIHNTYFQNLIASGKTTEMDLDSVTGIRPYGAGFIGISKEAHPWENAMEMAKRAGAAILAIEDGSFGNGKDLLAWVEASFKEQPTAWVQESATPRVLEGTDVLSPTSLDRPRRVLLQWLPSGQAPEGATAPMPSDLSPQARQRMEQAARNRADMLQRIAETQSKIDDLERRLASLGGAFDWGIRNELRHNYNGQKSNYQRLYLENERKEMENCNEIFMRNIGDGYIFNCISAWAAKSDPQKAAESLLVWTEKYPQFPYLRAACLVRAAELLGPETSGGQAALLKFSQMNHPGLDGYRDKVESIRNTTQPPRDE